MLLGLSEDVKLFTTPSTKKKKKMTFTQHLGAVKSLRHFPNTHMVQQHAPNFCHKPFRMNVVCATQGPMCTTPPPPHAAAKPTLLLKAVFAF